MLIINMEPGLELVGYLVRHGELKKMSVWDGWGDFDLSEEGRQQAEAAARWLSFEQLGQAISSDVPRTMHTAEYLMETEAVLNPYLATDPNLRPWNVSDEFTGKEKTPERIAAFQKYLDDPSLVIPGGESRNQLHDRIQVIFQYLATPYKCRPSVLFIHNSVIKSLLGLDDIKEAVQPGGIIAVYLDEKGEFKFRIALGAVEPEIGVS